ncbi:MAG TPA: peptidoglycan-binding domain-containing protein [Bryobacteraceae bacterium]|jgi:hypothetical protein
MRRELIAAILFGAAAVVAVAQTSPQKKVATPPAKKAAPAIAQKKTVAPAARTASTPTPQKTTPRPATSTATTRRYYASRQQPARRYYRPVTQQSPTADRYREIQDALAARGYLKTPPTGVWDKDSIDAMTRFQQDQKLDPTGKLTARSLGALGLGPKPGDATAEPAGEATPLR